MHRRPMRGRSLGSALTLLLALGLAGGALAEPAGSEKQRRGQAYAARDFATCGSLFLAAAAAGDDPAGSYYNAACCLALAGKTDDALAAHEHAFAVGFTDPSAAQQGPDLVSLRADPRWQPLVDRAMARAKAEKEFWDCPAMHTPFRPELSEDEKVAGLSKLWAETKFNFIHFDRLPGFSWDSLYLEYLPRVRASKSTLEYYRLLIAMTARLKDGHTAVWMPKELMDEMYARPLLRTVLLEGKVVVVGADSLLRTMGLVPGLEITAVDGRPVRRGARHAT